MVALESCFRVVTNAEWAKMENIWAEAGRTGGKNEKHTHAGTQPYSPGTLERAAVISVLSGPLH